MPRKVFASAGQRGDRATIDDPTGLIGEGGQTISNDLLGLDIEGAGMCIGASTNLGDLPPSVVGVLSEEVRAKLLQIYSSWLLEHHPISFFSSPIEAF